MLKKYSKISIEGDSSIFNNLKVRESIEIFHPIFLFRESLPWLAKPTQRNNCSGGTGESPVHTAAQKIDVVGAGRTDAGVHAKEMFAHFDFDTIEDSKELTFRLNAFLPEDIAVQSIQNVQVEAHARFDAEERTYEYWVVQEKNPFYADFAHFVKLPLDVDA